MKEFFKKLLCRHHPHDVELIRWCEKHIPQHEPLCAVLEYQCRRCGKYIYLYDRGKERSDWISVMGNNKKEDFYTQR